VEASLRKSILAVAALCLASIASAQTPTRPVPVPKVNGPLPITADSYPFMAAGKLIEPIDLAKYGYVEEEYLVSGTANVYDWAPNGALTVKIPNAPYTTRILVRRPANAAQFSGNVIVEPLHEPRGHDWALMWGYSYDYFLEHHDAWVGVTMDPQSAAALKKFNAARYAAVTWANPNPSEACAAGGRGRGNAAPQTSDVEEGLRWDIFSQVAALLKGEAGGGPLAGFRVEEVYMGTQDTAITTYVAAVQNTAMLANGMPAYDGFVIKSGGAPGRIRRCAAAPGPDDPRRIVKNIDVPVINVEAQGEVVQLAPLRRPDSDDPRDRFRQYEVAGASHMDNRVYRFIPALAEEAKAGADTKGETNAWPFPGGEGCEPQIPITSVYLMSYTFHAAFMNLDTWVRKGIAPPKGQPIQITGTGPDAKVAMDQFGNALGGVRSPYVDVPVATYVPNAAGPMGTCRQLGYKVPFEFSKLDSMYGSAKNYASKVNQSVDRLVKERYLTESDGKKIKAELTGSSASNGTR
jgi:hypothetical protein